jgi:hypothetical protein
MDRGTAVDLFELDDIKRHVSFSISGCCSVTFSSAYDPQGFI